MSSKATSLKAKRQPPADALWADRDQLFATLNQAPDLTVALVATSYLDASLANLLRARFVDEAAADTLLAIGKPLESYGARCDAALALGVINKTTHADLKRIGKIRNCFAHHHLALAFDDADIRKLCDALSLNHDPVNVATGRPMKVRHISESHRVRTRFLMMAVYLGDKFGQQVLKPRE